MGFGVWGLGFGVWGLGFGFRDWGLGLRAFGFGVLGLGLCRGPFEGSGLKALRDVYSCAKSLSPKP